MRRPASTRGFTLVELLVVIGIIALLISILLPSLNAARRQANAVKCATQLRELGNSFRFYAIDNRNYYPPALMNSTTILYNIDGVDYPQTLPGGTRRYGAYWFNFINKYVTKTTLGSGTGTLQNSADARRTVVWGCNEFAGYNTTGLGTAADINPVQTGYGMNFTPFWQVDGGAGTPQAWNTAATPANLANGTGFYKATFWGKNSAMRMLLVDNALYLADAGAPPADNTSGLHSGDQNVTRDNNGTYVSMWRHGKFPSTGQQVTSQSNSGWDPDNAGKVAFNVLYCDGHVATESDPKIAYRAQRMKFPG